VDQQAARPAPIVFLSYSRQDSELAAWIKQQLAAEGVTLWGSVAKFIFEPFRHDAMS
jgi:hypothetical protein